MVFEPHDWLRPKNKLDDVTSDKITVLYGSRKTKMVVVLF